jgi:hypothetical protein
MPGYVDIAELITQLRQAGVRCDTRQYLAANEVLLAFAAAGRDLTADANALASHLTPIFSGSPDDQKLVRATVLALLEPKPSPPPPEPPTRSRWQERLVNRLGPAALSITGVLLVVTLAGVFTFQWYFGRHSLTGHISADAIADQPRPVLSTATLLYGTERIDVAADGSFSLQTHRAQKARPLHVSLDRYADQTKLVNFHTQAPIPFTLHAVAVAVPVVTPPDSPFIISKPLWIERQTVTAPRAAELTAIPWAVLSGIGIAVFTFVLAGLEFFHRRRRDTALKRMTAAGVEPPLMTLQPPAPREPAIASQILRRMGADFRRMRIQEAMGLSIEATVDATARAGGFVQAVSVARTASPDYLVLIDRRGAEDHVAGTVNAWMNQLKEFGVAIDCFYFSEDPRICWNADTPSQRQRLSELLAQHHSASVMLFAETAICIESISGQPTPWARGLRILPRCALMTLESPYRWSRTEQTLIDAGYVVLPATVRGLQVAATLGNEWQQPLNMESPYARAYPSLISEDEMRWLDRNAPPQATVEKLLQQLQGFLGSKGYLWLCACAIYPQISRAITLSVLDVLLAGDELGRRRALEEQLPALSRLPWFRYGYMPDWLRRLCIASLPVDVDDALRRHLGDLLFVLLKNRDGADPQPVDAAQSATALRLWLNPLDIAASAPAGSPLRDAVFLGYIGRADLDPLALRVNRLPPVVRVRSRSPLAYLHARWRLLVVERPRAMHWLVAVAAGAAAFAAPLAVLEPLVQLPPGSLSITLAVPAVENLLGSAGNSAGPVYQVSSDGRVLAVSSGSSGIVLANADTAQIQVKLDSPPVKRLALNEDGTLVAALQQDNNAVVWDVRNRQKHRAFSTDATEIAMSTDGQQVVLAGSTEIAIMSSANGDRLKSFSLGTPMTAVAISANGRFVASTQGNSVIIVWDTSSSEKLSTVYAQGFPKLDRLAVSDDGRWLAAGASNLYSPSDSKDAIRVWDLSRGGAPLSHTQVGMTNFTLQFSPRGNRLLIRQTTDCWWLDLNNGAAIGKNIPLTQTATKLAQNAAPNSAPAPLLLAVRYTSAPENTAQTNVELLQWSIEPLTASPTTPRPVPQSEAAGSSTDKLRAPPPSAKSVPSTRPRSNPQRVTINKSPAQEPASGFAPGPVQAPQEKDAQPQAANPANTSLRGADAGGVPSSAAGSGNNNQGAAPAQQQNAAPVQEQTAAPAQQQNAAPVQTPGVKQPAAPGMLAVNGAGSSDTSAASKAPAAPSGFTVTSGDDAPAPSLELAQSSFTTPANGETITIRATNGRTVGDFTATLKTASQGPRQVPTPGEAVISLRGLQSLSNAAQTFDSSELSFNTSAEKPGTTHSKQAGALLFTVAIVPGRGMRVDVRLSPPPTKN